ncbi:MAG: dimethyl sulfoxide reductase anchor subunit [Opitutae bacterium]|nr:dimethyl sulfoxide reductase anchor subunit [Opitutae bacterium]
MVADGKTIIDAYLEEQRRLQTPVARFPGTHGGGTAPALAPVYRDLIPLTAPGPGEQYAFEVDLDACTGCKACVAACHSLNGLDDSEAWRDTGVILGGTPAAPYQQTVTTACHHCADPGCLEGCPVLAYEKDPRTGIVRHLDDQCIGCQYCILKCPYDVPKYNERLGIVRKCDMCHQRLAHGEAPACVQACPTHAIRIVAVSVTRTAGGPCADTSHFLAAAPDPAFTQPTTRYVSRLPLPADAHAADAHALRPQPPHWPLVVMLTLLPSAIVFQILSLTPFAVAVPARWLPWATGLAGLAAATFHLGRPLRAWRVFLGLQHSWFSREAVLFGLWFGITALALSEPFFRPLAALTGFAGLLCSVMIYVDTHRAAWRLAQTLPRFFGTGAVLALAVATPRAAAFVLTAKLLFELTTLRDRSTAAQLLRGPLRRATHLRFALGAAALCGLLYGSEESVIYYMTLSAALAGELAERYLFFRSVDAPKMPGQPQPATGSTPA